MPAMRPILLSERRGNVKIELDRNYAANGIITIWGAQAPRGASTSRTSGQPALRRGRRNVQARAPALPKKEPPRFCATDILDDSWRKRLVFATLEERFGEAPNQRPSRARSPDSREMTRPIRIAKQRLAPYGR